MARSVRRSAAQTQCRTATESCGSMGIFLLCYYVYIHMITEESSSVKGSSMYFLQYVCGVLLVRRQTRFSHAASSHCMSLQRDAPASTLMNAKRPILPRK